MKVRKAIKKILALSTGAAMLGATMFGAMAADLANYPSPLFIKDGVFSGTLVVGDNAAAEDIIGVTNIATSLQAAAVKKTVVSDGGTTVTIEGDAKQIGTTSNFLEIGETLNAAGLTTVDSSDLGALQDGTFVNSKGTFTYTQSVDLPDNANVVFYDEGDQSTDPALYLKFFSGQPAYTYKISFTPALESDVDSDNNLKDLRDETLNILGKDYSIITATNTSSQIVLKFFSGANTDILAEGSSKTYTIKGKNYDVTASYISTSEAMFTVNTQTTDKMVKGDTYTLSDGTEIGVRDILAQNYAGEASGGDKVQFSLGANKIEIKDTAPTTDAYDATVTVGSEDLGNVGADIVTSGFSSAVTKISGLNFRYQPSSDLYVPVDGSLSVRADAEEGETGNVIFGGFDIEFKGLSTGSTEDLKIEPDGATKYKLTFQNRNGDTYSLPVWSAKSNSEPYVLLGDYDGSTYKKLHINESDSIADEDYFILSPSETQKTHIMQFKSVNSNSGTFKIKDAMVGGQTWEVSNGSNVNIDGTSYDIWLNGGWTTPTLRADMNGDGSTGTAVVSSIYTKYSGSVGYLTLRENVSAMNQTANYTQFTTEKTEGIPSLDFQENINWTLSWDAANDKLKLASPISTFGSMGQMSKLEDKDVYVGYTYYGVYGKYDYTNADQPSFSFTYPDNQAQALVYVTSGATTSGTSTTGTTTDVVQPIDVGAVKLASEVTDVNAQNLILVGGPCANSVARQVMGATTANCADGFEAGKAMIKLYEQAPGKVAMVVAGFNGIDTRRASQVVAGYKDYASSLTGSEVVVTTVTSTPTVAAPTVVTTTTTTTETTTETPTEDTTGTQ